MRKLLKRGRSQQPANGRVVRRQVITAADTRERLDGCDERLQQEIRDLIKDQEPGRYRVRVRRKQVQI